MTVDVMAELGRLIPRDGKSGTDETERARDAADEQLLMSALAGKVTDWRGKNGDRYRDIVERRVAACVSVAGCTWTAMKQSDPARYRRFLRGTTRAIRREAALSDGTLSLGDLAELRRRFTKQRDLDRYAEEFPDFEDYGDRVSP